jgi:hypothetical protein
MPVAREKDHWWAVVDKAKSAEFLALLACFLFAYFQEGLYSCSSSFCTGQYFQQ